MRYWQNKWDMEWITTQGIHENLSPLNWDVWWRLLEILQEEETNNPEFQTQKILRVVFRRLKNEFPNAWILITKIDTYTRSLKWIWIIKNKPSRKRVYSWNVQFMDQEEVQAYFLEKWVRKRFKDIMYGGGFYKEKYGDFAHDENNKIRAWENSKVKKILPETVKSLRKVLGIEGYWIADMTHALWFNIWIQEKIKKPQRSRSIASRRIILWNDRLGRFLYSEIKMHRKVWLKWWFHDAYRITAKKWNRWHGESTGIYLPIMLSWNVQSRNSLSQILWIDDLSTKSLIQSLWLPPDTWIS